MVRRATAHKAPGRLSVASAKGPGGGSEDSVRNRASAPAAFRRIGQLGDGWLGSFLTQEEARGGREQIQRAAAEAGREIEPDHFGINLAVSDGDVPDALAAAVKRRRPDVDPADLIAGDWPHLHRQLDAYVAVGLTKFVIRPAQQPNIDDFIDRFVAELVPRQH